MKSFAVLTILSATTIASLSASAQFAMPKVPSLVGSSGSSQDLTGSQDQLASQYVAASNSVLAANAHMASALQLKDDAAKANAVAQAATSGATTETLSNNDSVTGATTKAIAEAMKNPPPMDAKAKSEYAVGLGNLSRGLIQYLAMRNGVTSFAKNMTTVSPALIPKLQVGAYIGKSLPVKLTDLTASLKNAVSFAQSHDIAVPADATQALAAIGS